MSMEDPNRPQPEGPYGVPPPVPPAPTAQRAPRPPTLDYVRPIEGEYVPRTPVWVQFFIGVLAPYIGSIGLGAMVSLVDRRGDSVLLAGILGLLAVFVIGAVARVKFKWRGFLPGVFVGIGLGLLGVGVVIFVICGSLWR
jgi:hypothetical protein